jgi:hypothetical protein
VPLLKSKIWKEWPARFAAGRPLSQSAIATALNTSWVLPNVRHTPGLWVQKTRPAAFSLIVDDFAVKHVGLDTSHHFTNALLSKYEITTDWGGALYSGITLEWDYAKRTYHIFEPVYVANFLSKFQHTNPKQPTHSP